MNLLFFQSMCAPQNKVLRHKSIGFLLAFVLSFLAVFNVSSACTSPSPDDYALQSASIDSELASNTHSERTLNNVSEFCTNPGCEAMTECAVACSMSMDCTSLSVLFATTSTYAQPKSTIPFSVPYSITRYVSRRSNSPYRPPIC